MHADAGLVATCVASKPILVVQFQQSGVTGSENGDPSMEIIPPLYQFTTDTTFATPESGLVLALVLVGLVLVSTIIKQLFVLII